MIKKGREMIKNEREMNMNGRAMNRNGRKEKKEQKYIKRKKMKENLRKWIRVSQILQNASNMNEN